MATELELINIRDKIEKMNKHNQIEILKILAKDIAAADFNENANGIYINLFEVKKDVLDRIINYVKFVESQESILNEVEQQKEVYKKLLDA